MVGEEFRQKTTMQKQRQTWKGEADSSTLRKDDLIDSI